ncbi:MAG: TetR/AcrR family transcriptional regulator [Bacteroides sp.]|nr:TetR/AcrR family transcriptional regulator [Bacteroides sp.]
MTTTSNPKRMQILATGKELFWKFGFKRVTIEEICKAAGVSKMTFYKFFPNKIDLAKTILDNVFDESILKIRRISIEHESTDKTLRRLMQMKSEGSRDISEEFIKDLYANPDAGLKSYMEEKTNSMFAEITGIYEKGKEDGWIRKDLNIPFFMTFTRKLIPIYSDDEILHFFDSSQELIMEITNLFVYGVSPHK